MNRAAEIEPRRRIGKAPAMRSTLVCVVLVVGGCVLRKVHQGSESVRPRASFDMNCPTHLVAGTWRDPESDAAGYKDIAYWTRLAQICERGLFDGIFIADVLGVYDVYGHSNDAALRGG